MGGGVSLLTGQLFMHPPAEGCDHETMDMPGVFLASAVGSTRRGFSGRVFPWTRPCERTGD